MTKGVADRLKMPSSALPSIAFCDFWPGFTPDDNPFLTAMAGLVRPAPRGESPDILVYSAFGHRHRRLAGDQTVKIFYTGENVPPDFTECDYGLSFEYLDYGDRHLRFPIYALGYGPCSLLPRPELSLADIEHRRQFCAYVASNSIWAAPERRDFVLALNRLRKVTSAGKHLRNHQGVDTVIRTGSGPERKRAFLADFRFSIACENSSHPGYTTEKIRDAFMARTIPIYWGDPRVTEEFNPAAFINVHSFASFADAAKAVVDLDNQPEALLAMLNAPVFVDGRDIIAEHREGLAQFLRRIAKMPIRRRPRHGRARIVELEGRSLIRRLGNAFRGIQQERQERVMPEISRTSET
jgi:hypothetical protein